MRLDQYLVQKGFLSTRSKAQDAIKEGRVFIDENVVIKNSFQVPEGAIVRLETNEIEFVSRAGFKLYDVLKPFKIDVNGRVCIDVGASTGGFTDVLRKQGAKRIYAVDVGKDQLAEELKADSRVINMEQVNCRYLRKDMFEEAITFACMDVSFISIKLIMPQLFSIMEEVEAVVLIKPQFEAGKKWIGKNGIVKDEKVHMQVLRDIVSFVEELGYYVQHLSASSILGRDGNKEFVMHISEKPMHCVFDYKRIVKEYHVR